MYDLGLTDGWFWGMTLRRFSLLVERLKKSQKREDRRSGEVVAMLLNVNGAGDGRAVEWTDVFPEWKEQMNDIERLAEAVKLWASSTEDLSH